MFKKDDVLTNFPLLLTAHSIDSVSLTPRAMSLLDPLLDAEQFKHHAVKSLMIAGEGYNVSHVRRFLRQGIQVINAYGPSEANICSSKVLEDDGMVNNIGKVLQGCSMYVLDPESKTILKPGEVGELYIGKL